MVRFNTSLVHAATQGDEEFAVDAAFLGVTIDVLELVKSLLLLSVSVSPSLLRTKTWEVVGAVLAVPSGQFPVPQDNLSTTVLGSNEAQAKFEIVVLSKATFPEAALMLSVDVVVEKSGVTGSEEPTVPDAPHSISKYFFGAIVVPTGNVKLVDEVAAKLPVEEPYTSDHPEILIGEQLLL